MVHQLPLFSLELYLYFLVSIFHISQNLSLEQISVKLLFVGEDEKARETQA